MKTVRLLFSDAMARAIVAGRKTVVRRPVVCPGIMSRDRLEIARRLVACRHWRWLPGMLAAGAGRVCSVSDAHMTVVNDKGHYVGLRALHGYLPDLGDDLTRLGVLAVVRAAHKDESIGIARFGDEWCVTMAYMEFASGFATKVRMGILRRGPTEEAALLDALEAAP